MFISAINRIQIRVFANDVRLKAFRQSLFAKHIGQANRQPCLRIKMPDKPSPPLPSPDQPQPQVTSEFSRRLGNAHPTLFSVYCIAAAFGTYFCMYAFRKPFTAATFEDAQWLGIGFKTILVSAQVTGYTISKFIGIKVVSEMPAKYRSISILALIAIAELALLLFAVTPVPWNFIWLFVNGLPLGMVFGLVLGFLEGRKVSEALTAGLCASFILASGFVKSVGRSLILDYGINEYWMPL